jgi:FkbM family methyltransferase
MKWLTSIAKRILRFFDRKLVYVPKGNVWGNDLEADLATVVGRQDPICLDIGANRGQTIRLFQSIFSAARIEAFEPSNACFNQLAAGNWGPLVTCHHAGIGSRESTLSFNNYDDPALSSFLPLERGPVNPFSQAVVTSIDEVPVITVDGFVKDCHLEEIDVLKIDTQGFDFEVLKGAEGLLNTGSIRCVLVELNFIPLYANQANAFEIMEWLSKRAYMVVDFYEKKRVGTGIHWCTALFVYDGSLRMKAVS